MIITKKTIWALFFMVGFFLYASQLLAQEDNRSFFEKFFDSTLDNPIESEPPFGIDTDSITEKPVIEVEDIAKPEQADPEALNQNAVEAPSKEPIIEAEDFAKPEQADPEALNQDAVEAPSKEPIIEAEDFAKPEQADPEALNQDAVVAPSKEPIIEAEDFAKPEQADPEALNQDAVVAPSKEPIIEAEDFAKPEQADPEALNQDAVVTTKEPIIEKQNLVDPQSTGSRVLKKDMVSIPPQGKKQFLDAGDFRDPFKLLRGGRGDMEKVLKPGVTVDGIQFNSYNDSDLFIEKVYRDSRFRVKDVFGKVDHLEGGGCLYCHQGIERISKNHKFRCTKCHEGDRRRRTLPAAHKNLISNPSDLNHASKYCGKCHMDQIEQVEQSNMATGKSIINVTRYAWGAQREGDHLYSLRPKEEKGERFLPNQSEGEPVDAFLRTKCMRCTPRIHSLLDDEVLHSGDDTACIWFLKMHQPVLLRTD
jgi:hypothetical protein